MKNRKQLMITIAAGALLLSIALVIKSFIKSEYGEATAWISCAISDLIVLTYAIDDKSKAKA